MPPATNKADLFEVTQKEFEKLTKCLADIDHKMADIQCEDGISIKHVVGHRAHWTEMFFYWYHQGLETGVAHIPTRDHNWGELKEFNAQLRKDQAPLSWPEVRVMLEDSHAELMEFITSMSNDDLYAAPMKGGGNHWTTGRWAEASGASHYRSASKFVRACLRSINTEASSCESCDT